MSLSILNNIPGLAAENQLNITQSNLQQTLYQLSSGSRLNSGADDAAGLSIANGLQANITALTQSSQNATDGVGKLQVADGALSQITSLLNRAVTLATESANGTVTDSQRTALDNEFTSIKNEIDNIGQQTTYNGSAVFAAGPNSDAQVVSTATGLSMSSAISGQLILKWGSAGAFTSSNSDTTVGQLISDINGSGKDLQASLNSQGQLVVVNTDTTSNGPNATNPVALNSSTLQAGTSEISSSTDDTFLGNQNYSELVSANTGTEDGTSAITITPGTKDFKLTWGAGQGQSFSALGTDTTVNGLITDINTNSNGKLSASLVNGKLSIQVTDGSASTAGTQLTLATDTAGIQLAGDTGTTAFASAKTSENQFNVYLSDATSTGSGSISVDLDQLGQSNINGVSLSGNSLTSATNAQIALTQINQAISSVAALRGNIGAGINQLNAAVDVENVQVQNLTSAESNITSADISTEVSNMTKYNVLEQTGISALSQSNQMQQSLLKLLQ
jgi:flagellin